MRALPYDVRDVRHIFVIRECPVVRRRVAPTKTGQNKACSDAVRALPYDIRDARHIFVIRECTVVRRRGDPMWSPGNMTFHPVQAWRLTQCARLSLDPMRECTEWKNIIPIAADKNYRAPTKALLLWEHWEIHISKRTSVGATLCGRPNQLLWNKGGIGRHAGTSKAIKKAHP